MIRPLHSALHCLFIQLSFWPTKEEVIVGAVRPAACSHTWEHRRRKSPITKVGPPLSAGSPAAPWLILPFLSPATADLGLFDGGPPRPAVFPDNWTHTRLVVFGLPLGVAPKIW